MLGTDFFYEWGESDNIEVDTIVLSEWDGGATVSIVVTNNGSEAASDWGLRWESPGEISFFWDAEISMDGDVATALLSAERKIIAPGEAVAFGFNLATGAKGWTEPVFEFGRLAEDGTMPDPAPPIETPDPEPPVDAPDGQPGDDNPQQPPDAPGATDLLEVSVLKSSIWNTGFSANVVVANPTNTDMTLTEIRWAMPQGLSIESVWNAEIEVTNAIATATPDDAFLQIKAGQAVSFGFNASHPDGVAADILPTIYVVSDGETVPPDADGPPPVPTDPVPTDPWDGDAPLNPIIGTQTIGPGYTLTDENQLVETARAIEATGSNIIKIALDPTLYGMSSLHQWQPVELLSQNEAFRQVLQMDFDHYFFWLERSGPWVDNLGISQEEHDHEYAVTYALARYLLETFQDTGKTFYIGNWETDWNLLEWNPTVEDVNDTRIQGLIDWLNLRQDAIQGNRVKNELTAKTPDFLFLRARITDLGSMPALEMHPLRVIFDCFHCKHRNIAPEIRSPDYPGMLSTRPKLMSMPMVYRYITTLKSTVSTTRRSSDMSGSSITFCHTPMSIWCPIRPMTSS